MRLTEYQEAIKPSMAYSPKADPIGYHALALAGEVCEVCNKLKKIERGDFTLEQSRDGLIGECGGVCWYAAALANDLGFTLENRFGIMCKKLIEPALCGRQLAIKAGVVNALVDNMRHEAILGHLASIYSYVSLLGWWLGVPIEGILAENFKLITDRHARGVVHGNGDHR